MRTHASRQTRGEQTRAGKAECRVVTTLKDNESTAPPGLNPGSVPHAFSLPRTPPTSGSQQALPLWPQAPSLTPHTHSKLSRAPRPTPRPSESSGPTSAHGLSPLAAPSPACSGSPLLSPPRELEIPLPLQAAARQPRLESSAHLGLARQARRRSGPPFRTDPRARRPHSTPTSGEGPSRAGTHGHAHPTACQLRAARPARFFQSLSRRPAAPRRRPAHWPLPHPRGEAAAAPRPVPQQPGNRAQAA